MTTGSNAVLVEALSSSLRYGGSALVQVPDLLKRILAEEAWREFITPRGEVVRHRRFADFVTTTPTAGLGASMELIERIVGTEDPDLLQLLYEAKKVGAGTRTDLQPGEESTPSPKGEDSSLAVRRLAREAPELYESVRRGETSINAAAVTAGIRNFRRSVRMDDPDSAVRTLRKHMPAEVWDEFLKRITEERATP